MNNLSSYFGLVDAKIIASDKDLSVMKDQKNTAGMGISVMVTRSITQMIKCELQRNSKELTLQK